MFQTREESRRFALAGNARLTLVSEKSGSRYTFRIRKPNQDSPWFVSVLTGSNNETDYTFFGTIFDNNEFRHSKKSSITPDAASAKAFTWFWKQVQVDGQLPEHLNVHHEGRCGRCARALTVPESIESGFGPECINHIH